MKPLLGPMRAAGLPCPDWQLFSNSSASAIVLVGSSQLPFWDSGFNEEPTVAMPESGCVLPPQPFAPVAAASDDAADPQREVERSRPVSPLRYIAAQCIQELRLRVRRPCSDLLGCGK